MAGAFLSSAVIRLVTEKVLASVIEQLPRATNAGAPVDDQSQRQIIANVLAVKRGSAPPPRPWPRAPPYRA